MNGVWYAFTWRELNHVACYVVTRHQSVDDAILKVFELAGLSPNEHSKDFSGIKEACKKSPVISMSTGEKIDIPLWFIVHESELEEMTEGLVSRSFVVVLSR